MIPKITSSRLMVKVRSKGITKGDPREATVTDRQERIPGFDQAKLSAAKIGLVGAGGINSEMGRSLARKGVGALDIFDDDTVTVSNYSRQIYFQKDLFKKKALRLPRNLARECVGPTLITGYAMQFQDAVNQGIPMDADVYVFGVDNDEARSAGCRYFLGRTPIILLGTGATANHGYVYVQEPGEACFACMFPQALEDKSRAECVPSSIDILQPIVGLALYAIDSLLMARSRPWNYRVVYLDGCLPDLTMRRERSPNCPVCGDVAAAFPRTS